MGTTDKECDATNTSASQSLDATRHKGVDSLEPLLVWHVIGFVKDAHSGAECYSRDAYGALRLRKDAMTLSKPRASAARFENDAIAPVRTALDWLQSIMYVRSLTEPTLRFSP